MCLVSEKDLALASGVEYDLVFLSVLQGDLEFDVKLGEFDFFFTIGNLEGLRFFNLFHSLNHEIKLKQL